MYLFTKRILDILLSLFFLFVSIPLLLIFIVLIQLKSHGAVFYFHERLGKNGKLFNMWKLRTMHSDSDQLLKSYLNINVTASQEWNKYFCLKNDPRIIYPFGRIARRYSIDEIPQFWNVLIGDMSIVGPRPIPLNENELLETEIKQIRVTVKPGITGLWQIKGRSNLTIKEKVQIDLEYISKKGFYLDLKILFLTPIVVLSKKGAY